MDAFLVSIIAVAGTLLGSFSTYLFQRRTAVHAESVARAERLRQDRLSACGEFVAAVTEMKRGVVTSWFRRKTQDDEWRAAMTEADRLGAVAEGKLLQLLLILDDGALRRTADELLQLVDVTIRGAAHKVDVEAHERTFADTRLGFIERARELIG